MTDKPDMCAALHQWADRLRDENATMAAELAGYANAWKAERAAMWKEIGECSGGYRTLEKEVALSAERIAEQDEEIARLRLCRQELLNIAQAKRFDRGAFRDDTDFADWAQTRCRFTLEKTQ
jgi:hypothetical protein